MFIWFLRIIALLLLLWFIAPIFKGYYNAGNKLGIAICVFALLCTTHLYDIVHDICHKYSALTVVFNTAKCLVYLFIAYAVIITIAMIIASLIKPKKDATAVTLGIRTDTNGPSPLLMGRIMATKVYLDKTPSACAVLSGGKCKRDYTAEAKCMYDTLLKLGVDGDRLIIEDKALSTYENLLFSNRIISEQNKEKNLAIVSDSFHHLRARLIAKKLGIKAHIGAVNSKSPFLYIPTYYVREWVALPYEALFRFRPHRQ